LQRSGYAGEGFFSKGHRLGVNVSHDLPPHLARQKALEAAEKRRQTAQVLGTGGRLGGRATNNRGLSLRELAAQAAERRARDDKACGSGVLAEREATKAAEDGIENKVIDLTMDDNELYADDVIIVDQTQPVTGPSKREYATPTARPTNGLEHIPTSARPNTSLPPKISPEWSCPMCTLLNQPQTLRCDACLAERPPDLSAGWTCMTCGEEDIPHDFWTCRFCGAVKYTD